VLLEDMGRDGADVGDAGAKASEIEREGLQPQ
jgi:hypothetical protein